MGRARRLFKTRHNMIEERSLGVKVSRFQGRAPLLRDGGRVAEYSTELHILDFMEMNVLKLLRQVPSQALGSYASGSHFNIHRKLLLQ